jgi:hypothetical protein
MIDERGTQILHERLARVDRSFDEIDRALARCLDEVDGRFAKIDRRFAEMKQGMQDMRHMLDDLERAWRAGDTSQEDRL